MNGGSAFTLIARRRATCAIALLAACLPPAASTASADHARPRYELRIDLTGSVHALGSDDLFVSGPAEERLEALGVDALPVLDRALRQEPADVRAGIVTVLATLNAPRATRLLIRAAGDRDPAVRAPAFLALAARPEAGARDAVAHGLRDQNAAARRAAAAACSQACTTAEALQRLVEIAIGDAEAATAQASLDTIMHGDASRAALARQQIERQAAPQLASADATPTGRFNAALLVAIGGNRDAVPMLAIALQQAPLGDATRAARALANVADPASVAALATAARPELRPAACASLLRLRDAQVAGSGDALRECPRPSAKPATGATP